MDDLIKIIQQVMHYIGSAMPLTILCYMIVFILKGNKIKDKTINSYAIISILLFLILWRT